MPESTPVSPPDSPEAPAKLVAEGEIVKLSPEEARLADESKLAGKTLEVTGVVGLLSQTGKLATIALSTGEFTTIPFTLEHDEVEPWAKVGVGQTVTLRGRFGGPKTYGMVFWKLQPTVGPPIYTAEALAEMITKNPQQAARDLEGQAVIVTGTVTKLDFNDVGAAGIDIEGNKDCIIHFTAFNDFKPLLEKYKVGSKIQFAGNCHVDLQETPKQILMVASSPITVPLPVAGVEYAKGIEALESRLKKQSEAMLSAQAELTVSAVDLHEEFKKDGNEARTKYEKKVVEITGKVRKLEESTDGSHDIIKLATTEEYMSEDLPCELVVGDPWNTLAPGQTVVVRGNVIKGIFGAEVKEALVVKVEEAGKPVEATLDELAAELKKDPQAFAAKYSKKSIIVSGPLDETTSFSSTLKGADDFKIKCSFGGDESGKHRSQFAMHKPGDTVRILGMVTGIDADAKRIELEECWARPAPQ